MESLERDSSILEFETEGSPPDLYRVTYRGHGTYFDAGETIVKTSRFHRVEIRLGAEYPRMKPMIRWCTPIFHPNISAAGSVCLGGYTTHWVPSLKLADLCEMLWEMLRYANYDTRNPFNPQAAAWARKQKTHTFPLDDRFLRDRLSGTRLPPRREPAPGSSPAGEGKGDADTEEIFFIGND
jgi:ubiquitin-protein ligase